MTIDKDLETIKALQRKNNVLSIIIIILYIAIVVMLFFTVFHSSKVQGEAHPGLKQQKIEVPPKIPVEAERIHFT
jgi:flagellar basal body-associated protein FliL